MIVSPPPELLQACEDGEAQEVLTVPGWPGMLSPCAYHVTVGSSAWQIQQLSPCVKIRGSSSATPLRKTMRVHVDTTENNSDETCLKFSCPVGMRHWPHVKACV